MGWQRHSSGDDLKRISFAYKKAFKIEEDAVLFLVFSVPQNKPRHIQVRAEGYNDYLEVGELLPSGSIQYFPQDERKVIIDLDGAIDDILADKGLSLAQIQNQDKISLVVDSLNKISRIYGTRKP